MNFTNTKINSLKKIDEHVVFFNTKISSNDLKNAFDEITKMRIIHGKLISKQMHLLNSSKTQKSNKTYLMVSCLNTILIIIENKIAKCETTLAKLSNNKTFTTNLSILYDDNTNLDIPINDVSNLKTYPEPKIDPDPKTELNLKPNEILNNLENLPLFDGKKSSEVIIVEKINKAIIESPKIPEYLNTLFSLILFYDPHCHACVKTKPEWKKITDKLQKQVKKDGRYFNIIEINVSEKQNENLCSLFEIESIPTIVMMEPTQKPKAQIEKMVGMADEQRIKSFITDTFTKLKSV